MSKPLLFFTALACALSTCFSLTVNAQITVIADSFNDGNITAAPTWTGNTSRFTVSNSSPLEGTHSLRSATSNNYSYISTQYGTNTNLTGANYTWTLLYRANTGSNPNELPYGASITAGTNHWRYWIAATTNNPATAAGFIISHSAGNLKISRRLAGGSTWDIATYPISLNTTYSIKVIRRNDGYFYWYIDTGTAEATTLRNEFWATDALNSGTSNIFMIFEANETSANRFQWDQAGMFMKSLSVSQLTAGVYTGELEQGMTNRALIGFAASSIGSITLQSLKIQNTENNTVAYSNLYLYSSVDNDYSTAGDNTLVPATITLNGNHVLITGINAVLNSTTRNYFLVADVVSASAPPPSMQFTMSCVNCGAPNTNVVTASSEKVNDFSFSSNLFSFIRVFNWRNTTSVGDFTDDWQNASAWDPYRNDVSANDILRFSKGGTVNPRNIPNQTAKRIIVMGNTTVNITTASLTNNNAVLTVGGGSGDDFEVESGSTLNVNSTGNTFGIHVPTGTTGAVYGAINFSGKNHTLTAANTGAISFNSGSVFTGGTALSGNPFGNSVGGSVTFTSGSLLIDQVGLDYFSPADVLGLQSGSTYRHATNVIPSINNKTFGNLDINTGNTLNIGANTYNVTGNLTGAGVLTMTSGVMNLGGDFTGTGTFNYGAGVFNYNGSSAQIVRGSRYYQMQLNGGGIKTAAGNITIDNTLTLNSPVTMEMQANTLSGVSAVSGGGLLRTSSASVTPLPAAEIWGTTTVEYYREGPQTVVAGVYNNLIISGSASKTIASTFTVDSNLHIASGCSLLISGNSSTLSGVESVSGTGTLLTACSAANPLPANKTWTGVVEYNRSGTQNVVAGTYQNLVLGGTSTKTVTGNLIINDDLNIKAAVTCLLASPNVISSVNNITGPVTGILQLPAVSPILAIPSGKTWPVTVQYTGAAQSVISGNYSNLTIAGTSGNKIAQGPVDVSGTLSVSASRVFEMASYQLTGMFATSGTGTLTTTNTSSLPVPADEVWAFTVNYNGTGNQTVVAGDYVNLTISGARTTNSVTLANDTIQVSGTFTASATFSGGGTYIRTGNTMEFDGVTQTLPAFTYQNLIISGTGNKTAGATTINGVLSINPDRMLLMSTAALSGSFTTEGSGTLRTSNTGTTPIPSGINWGNLTVEYNSTAAQRVVAGSYHDLLISGARSGSNSVTFINGGTVEISGDLLLTSTFATGSYITTNNTVVFNGATQNIPAFTFNNLGISGTSDKTMSGNNTVNGALQLIANSIIVPNAYTLTLNGTVTSSAGYIRGGSCGAAGGSISIAGTSSLGSIPFDPANNNFNTITINRTSSGAVSFSTSLMITGQLILTNGVLTVDDVLNFHTANIPVTRTNGTITLGANSTLQFGGCNPTGSAFTLPSGLFTTAPTFRNLIHERTNGISLGNQMMNVTGTVRILAGNLTTGGQLTLISNAAGTARVDSIVCISCGISGNVTAQRYVPGGAGKRRWRMLAAPVNVGGSMSITQLMDNIHVTGTGGSANGFDNNPPINGPSFKTYDETLNGASNVGWVFPANSSVTFPTGKGAAVFVRGDRDTPDPFNINSVANNATIDYTGSVNSGLISPPITYTNYGNAADGWNLVANPYPSTIDWNSAKGWTKQNIQNKIWLYNPANGSYGTYVGGLNQGTNGSTRHISSGQGFFIKATGASPVLSFRESVKVDSAGSSFYRSATQQIPNMIRLTVSKDSMNSDEALLYLNTFSSTQATDEYDTYKFFNDDMNFYFKSSDGINLVVNSTPIPAKYDTLHLSIFSYDGSERWTGGYRVDFSGMETLEDSIDLYFLDIYTQQIIDMREFSSYLFSIDNETASMGNDRFRIIVHKTDVISGTEKPELKKNNHFVVYPNPFTETIRIAMSDRSVISNEAHIVISDQLGRVIREEKRKAENNIYVIDGSDLIHGYYFITISSGDYKETKRLVK